MRKSETTLENSLFQGTDGQREQAKHILPSLSKKILQATPDYTTPVKVIHETGH